MNKYKIGYIVSSVLDYVLTFGGTLSIIVLNYIDEENSVGYKISFSGIILLITTLFVCKAIFEHNYQNKQNSLLQQLGSATDPIVKDEINKQINAHKLANSVYQRLMILLPFFILYFVTFLGAKTLDELNSTVGMILMFMLGGSAFNIIKKPLQDKANTIKFQEKALKKASR